MAIGKLGSDSKTRGRQVLRPREATTRQNMPSGAAGDQPASGRLSFSVLESN
jgi:hypothetical protein